MRSFLIGLVLGACLVLAIQHLVGEPPPSREDERPLSADEERQDAPSAGPLLRIGERRPEPAAPKAPPAPQEPLPPGTIVLRPGEGAILATGQVLSGDEAANADVLCLEIQRGYAAVLGCRHGAAQARIPKAYQSGPFELLDTKAAFERTPTAPAALDAPELRVRTNAWRTPGFGFVRDAERKAWKVWAVRVTSEPVVLDRRVFLMREQVATAADGGMARLPVPALTANPLASDEVRRVVAIARPLVATTVWMERALKIAGWRSDDIPSGVRLPGQAGMVFDRPLGIRVETRSHSGVFARAGTTPDAHVTLDHHSVMVVQGDLDGHVVVDDHGLLYVQGETLGTVSVEFLGLFVAAGRVKGTVTLDGSNAKVVLLEGIDGRLVIENATGAVVYVRRHLNRADIERLAAGRRDVGVTLHVPDSDLGKGKHERIGAFGTVVVGDAFWSQLPR